jgi:hypothetical protein
MRPVSVRVRARQNAPVSSVGTDQPGTVYGVPSASASARISRRLHRDGHGLMITISSVIAAFLTMLGAASILAGLSGVVGIEPLGLVRAALYLGLGFAGAGSGGLLLIILGDLRKTHDADPSADSFSA